MATDAPEVGPKQRLLASGARIIADKGFEGASVREICTDAETGINMIHHYFGNKQGLLEAIVEQFGSGVFEVPLRLVQKGARSRDDFVARLELLFESTLDAYIEHRDLFLVVYREEADPKALPEFTAAFVAFLQRAQEAGFMRAEADPEMVTGFYLDRILNQVQLAPWIKRNYGNDLIGDADYRRRWCASNVDVFINGIATPTAEQQPG